MLEIAKCYHHFQEIVRYSSISRDPFSTKSQKSPVKIDLNIKYFYYLTW